MKKVSREEILNGNLWTVILGLSIPIVLNSFIQSMYNLTDTYWLGTLGTNQMAGITLVSPVQNIVLNFGTGITTAGAILMSQYLGARKDQDAKDMLRHIFLCSMIFSFVCAGIVCASSEAICTWLGAEGEVFAHGKTYLQIVVLDMPFLYCINIYTSARQAQGDTVRPMLLNLSGAVLNMILDPLMIVTLDMGTAGAALATLIAKVPCAVFALAALRRSSEQLRLELGGFRFDGKKVSEILRIGIPTALGGSILQFGFLIMTKSVNAYGPSAMAAYGIGNKINGIITLPSNAIGSAVSTVVGQNIGAKQVERAEKGYKLARDMSVVFLFVGGLILSAKPVSQSIVSIFSDEADVIFHATNFLRLMAICCFSNGIYNATTALFQGTGHTMVTMIVGATRLWVWRFAVLYVCQTYLHMGVESVWWAVVMSNFISTAIIYICYRMNLWRRTVIKLEPAKEIC